MLDNSDVVSGERTVCVFFFNDTATTEIYTLSLHVALPIYSFVYEYPIRGTDTQFMNGLVPSDRKSTRLNSSHTIISYAVFCLKKKTHKRDTRTLVPAGLPATQPYKPSTQRGETGASESARAPWPDGRRRHLLLFFFNNPGPPEISPLPLPAALPI